MPTPSDATLHKKKKVTWEEGTVDPILSITKTLTPRQQYFDALATWRKVTNGDLEHLKDRLENQSQPDIDNFLARAGYTLFERLSYDLCAEALEYINEKASPELMSEITSTNNFRFFKSFCSRLYNPEYPYNSDNAKRVARIYIKYHKEALIGLFNDSKSALPNATCNVFLAAWEEAYQDGEVTEDTATIKQRFWSKEEYQSYWLNASIIDRFKTGDRNIARPLYRSFSDEKYEEFTKILSEYSQSQEYTDTILYCCYSLYRECLEFYFRHFDRLGWLLNFLSPEGKRQILAKEIEQEPYFLVHRFVTFALNQYFIHRDSFNRSYSKRFFSCIVDYVDEGIIRDEIENYAEEEKLKQILFSDLEEAIMIQRQENTNNALQEVVPERLLSPSLEKAIVHNREI